MTVMGMMNTIQMRALNRGHNEEKFEDAKGLSEAMNRRTDNTMTKRKKHTR